MFRPSQRLLKLLLLVLLAIFFYALARAEFLSWNWKLFQNKSLWDLFWAFFVGLRFDLSAIVALMAPLLLWTFIPWPESWERFWRLTVWLGYVSLQLPFLLLNLVDTEFINFVGRRFSYENLFILKEAEGKLSGFVSTYWGLFLVNALMLFLFALCAWLILKKNVGWRWPFPQRTFGKYATHILLCFLSLCLSVIAIRGGLQSKPLSFVNANIFAAPLLNNLSLNSTFTFIKSYGFKERRHEKYFTEEGALLRHLNGSLQGSLLEGRRPARPQNVIIILLESFGLEYVGPHDGKSFTPFLDELARKSLNFENAYANGRRSIEGVAAVIGGIPALMSEPFISSQFTSNYFLGLGTLLTAENYSSSFFHGGRNGTMYFDSFMKSAGVEQYYGSNEYDRAEDDDGIWGIWDEPFLQWMITKLNMEQRPFLSAVFTLSSHHPFKVPAQYEGHFPEGPQPILKTVAYTDHALKKFFAEAEKHPWFKDTLFIITADHTSLHYRPEFDNEIGNYRIPFLVYHPTLKLPEVDTKMVVQQLDILPTVLDFLSVPEKDKNYLGSSLFIPGDKVAVNFIDGRYLLTARDFQIRWSPEGGEPEMFAISDVNAQKPLLEPKARKEELVLKLKATMQYFAEGMWDNKLYYPTPRQ